MGKKKKHEEEESEERWLITYADMITLLVAFFMMMYSMSVINLEKFKAAAIGIRSGFNGSIDDGFIKKGDSLIQTVGQAQPVSESPMINIMPAVERVTPKAKKGEGKKKGKGKGKKKGEGSGQGKSKKAVGQGKGKGKGGGPGGAKPLTATQMRAKRVGTLTKKFEKELEPLIGKGKAAQVTAEKKGVAIELVGDMIFFPLDSAKLSDEAKRLLDAVVNVLETVPNEVSVEGHTSKFVPLENSPFANSWELSTARAMAVVTYTMQTGKIEPKRVSVTGYGQYRPMKKGKTKEAVPTPTVNNDRVRVFIFQD